jgi:hypothetical protein
LPCGASLNGHQEHNGIHNPTDTEDNKLDDNTDITDITEVNEDTNEDLNEDNNEELTPPPDSPIEDTMSRASSIPPNALQDEIVVGSNAHKRTPPRVTQLEDVVMGESEGKPLVIQHPKRKRASGV